MVNPPYRTFSALISSDFWPYMEQDTDMLFMALTHVRNNSAIIKSKSRDAGNVFDLLEVSELC